MKLSKRHSIRLENAPLKGARAIGANMTEVEHGDLTVLYSYETPVAFLSPRGGYVTEKKWSVTTSKHIAKFFARHGYDRKGAFKVPQEDIEMFVATGKGPQDNPPVKPGDRIVVTDYGVDAEGVVTRIGRSGSIIFVRLDKSPAERWFHAMSVRKIEGNPRPRRTGKRMGLIHDMQFFRQHGGGVVGEAARGALDLARAEREMQRRGWVVTWEPDNDADLSWMSDEERAQEHEVYVAILWNTDPVRSRRPGHMNAKVLASLGGIVDPSREYQRVVEAELASEALAR